MSCLPALGPQPRYRCQVTLASSHSIGCVSILEASTLPEELSGVREVVTGWVVNKMKIICNNTESKPSLQDSVLTQIMTVIDMTIADSSFAFKKVFGVFFTSMVYIRKLMETNEWEIFDITHHSKINVITSQSKTSNRQNPSLLKRRGKTIYFTCIYHSYQNHKMSE